METLFKLIGAICTFVFLLLYSPIAWGVVFYYFWYWFLLPVFTELPHITLSAAIGLGLFSLLLKRQTGTNIKEKYRDKSFSGYWFPYITLPWIGLFVGWLFKFIIY